MPVSSSPHLQLSLSSQTPLCDRCILDRSM
uniref:Uncharacterized protein n=1 Tax=Arundo donax TaxID=35708 RepID=A0A0A9EDK5_ARUDO